MINREAWDWKIHEGERSRRVMIGRGWINLMSNSNLWRSWISKSESRSTDEMMRNYHNFEELEEDHRENQQALCHGNS